MSISYRQAANATLSDHSLLHYPIYTICIAAASCFLHASSTSPDLSDFSLARIVEMLQVIIEVKRVLALLLLILQPYAI